MKTKERRKFAKNKKEIHQNGNKLKIIKKNVLKSEKKN